MPLQRPVLGGEAPGSLPTADGPIGHSGRVDVEAERSLLYKRLLRGTTGLR
ncbi:hypothetical protein D3C71_2196720 [compost metagenome]